MKTTNIHATCVSFEGKGILLVGKSGAGKSDFALRLITQKGALLVADDRVDLCAKPNMVFASCPLSIKGLLEVRGVGICEFDFLEEASIDLVVELVATQELERLPNIESYDLLGKDIPKVKLSPFEQSSTEKLMLLLKKTL